MPPKKKRKTPIGKQSEIEKNVEIQNAPLEDSANKISHVITSNVTEFEVANDQNYQFMWFNTFSSDRSDYKRKARIFI